MAHSAKRGVRQMMATCVGRSPTQLRVSDRHAVTSALRETGSKAEPVHGSAKQSVVAVRSPSGGSAPEGASSGRALFLLQCAPLFGRVISRAAGAVVSRIAA